MGSEEKTIIIVVLLVVILAVGIVASAFIFFSPFSFINRVTSRPGPVEVIPLVLYVSYPTSSDNYFGPSYRFLDANPMYFQHGTRFQASFALALGGSTGSHSVNSISLGFSPGFTLLSVNPRLPLTMSLGSSQNFTITLQAPSIDYTGPVTVNLFTR